MISIANAPCSWGVIENVDGETSTYLEVLSEMQQAGYTGTELGDWGFMPTDPDQLRDILDRHRLKLLGSWVSVRLYDETYHQSGIDQAVQTARLMAEVGGPACFVIIGDDHSTVPDRTLYAGRIKPDHRLDERGWDTYTTGAMRVAEAVKKETGLRSLIHHHGATYVETPEEVAHFLAHTDPALVGLCFDTGHYALGGGDPVEALHAHKDRIAHVHFKDFDPGIVHVATENGWDYPAMIGQGVFPELGKGVVDFKAVLQTLSEIAYDDWIVVEQDVLPGTGSPFESALRNREYLKAQGV